MKTLDAYDINIKQCVSGWQAEKHCCDILLMEHYIFLCLF